MAPPKQQCEHCEKYKKEGHNYCRMCGHHLTKGFVQFVRIALAYTTAERYCGYCGGLKNACKCLGGKGAYDE